MKRFGMILVAVAAVLALGSSLVPSPREAVADQAKMRQTVERGGYLVDVMGCADCHTPQKMGPNGPERDLSMRLAGHPAAMDASTPPQLEAPWMAATTSTMTAWAGPWGISYSSNLTPDPETGLGNWTEKDFVATVRTGRHRGKGRPILPPMPMEVLQHLTDEDLSAVFAYLQSIPAVNNPVPAPQSPPEK